MIHTAYRQDGPEARSIVVDGSENVARAAAAVGARLVHLSTDVVFDGRAGRPYREDDVPSPCSAYGAAKAEAEARVAAAHPGAVIVRTSLIVGGPGHAPSKHELAALDPEATFYDDELRSPVLVGDLAHALLELAGPRRLGAAPRRRSRRPLPRRPRGARARRSRSARVRAPGASARLPPRLVARAGAPPHRPPRRAYGARVNRLADSSSPYLLQHAGNPVDWNPWGDEAFARARERDVPLLVSVGYSSCHWCHVMEHESFSDPATAALMNDLFVNVKVDREERPDVDALTMEACVTMTGQGGWPTTVFLTPSGRPFYAGTYYPPEPRHGLPSLPAAPPGDRGDVARAPRRPRGAGGAPRRRARRRGAARGRRTTS